MSATSTETDSWEARTRTVVVSGVPDVLPPSRMMDKLVIHFQSRRSCGGDVELVTYPTNMSGVAFVTFDKAEDAERVVLKEQQVMTDGEFPADYLLTVFPFSRDVFLYVPSAVVDLSVFGRDQSQLIQSLRSAHRSLRFRPFLQQMKATIEGPFAAVQALRRDLILRAGRLKSDVSAQTPDVKLRETPLNPRVTSPCWFVGSEAKPGSSNCLSAPLQTTGEAIEVQSLLSNAQNASSRQKVSCDSLAMGSWGDTDNDDGEKQRGRSRHEVKADPRQVFNVGVRSSLSGLDLLSAQQISTKQPGETRVDSYYASTDYLKESDQSSSAATSEILRTRLKHDSTSSKSNSEAISPEDQEDMCVWVDSCTFRYIEKFDKKEFDRCLRGLDASVECKGAELTRILLTRRQNTRIQHSMEDLKSLVEYWQLTLRVQRIDFEEEEKQKLVKICHDVNLLYDNVLYMLEDSCVKVVGPSVSLYLFCKRVEDQAAKLKV